MRLDLKLIRELCPVELNEASFYMSGSKLTKVWINLTYVKLFALEALEAESRRFWFIFGPLPKENIEEGRRCITIL